MTLSEPIGSFREAMPRRDLAIRRPGHAVMHHLLGNLDRRGTGDVIPSDLTSWHVGAIGEVLVGQELARLPEGWLVLHSIPVGPSADIDHIVIGPSGIFILNTKRHPGKRVVAGSHQVWINGAAVQYQRDLLSRTGAVATTLRPLLGDAAVVHPLLVFVDSARFSTSGDQTVDAVPLERLISHLLSRGTVLQPGPARAAHTKLAQPATWGLGLSVLDEPDPTERFNRLTVLPAEPRVPVAAPMRTVPTVARVVQVAAVPARNGGAILRRIVTAIATGIVAPVLGLLALSWLLAQLLTAMQR